MIKKTISPYECSTIDSTKGLILKTIRRQEFISVSVPKRIEFLGINSVRKKIMTDDLLRGIIPQEMKPYRAYLKLLSLFKEGQKIKREFRKVFSEVAVYSTIRDEKEYSHNTAPILEKSFKNTYLLFTTLEGEQLVLDFNIKYFKASENTKYNKGFFLGVPDELHSKIHSGFFVNKLSERKKNNLVRGFFNLCKVNPKDVINTVQTLDKIFSAEEGKKVDINESIENYTNMMFDSLYGSDINPRRPKVPLSSELTSNMSNENTCTNSGNLKKIDLAFTSESQKEITSEKNRIDNDPLVVKDKKCQDIDINPSNNDSKNKNMHYDRALIPHSSKKVDGNTLTSRILDFFGFCPKAYTSSTVGNSLSTFLKGVTNIASSILYGSDMSSEQPKILQSARAKPALAEINSFQSVI